MAHHDQRSQSRGWACSGCYKAKDCTMCIDIARTMLGLVAEGGILCYCRKQNHRETIVDQVNKSKEKGK